MDSQAWWLHDFSDLVRTTADLERLRKDIGAVNPRRPGWHNNAIQFVKRRMARMLDWYTRPLHEFNASASRSLEEMARAMEQLSMTVLALERVHRAAPETRFVKDRTAYVVGLFGTGRAYLNDLISDHIGERGRLLRDTIRLHPGPTPMIYSGHSTVRYVSGEQESPEVTGRIIEAVRSGFADLIFIYRHPLDSLLTNWVWWRTYLRNNTRIDGLSRVYSTTDDLCRDLDEGFDEFRAFVAGDPKFFAFARGPRFLSFAEFVEETELHRGIATLALRLEDFMVDPRREFSKIAEVMSVDLVLGGATLARPRTKAFGYLAVKDKVPRFRKFIADLDADTRRRIEKLGFAADVG